MNTEAEIKFRAAIEEMVEGLQIIDRDWRYIFVNNAAAKHGRTDKSKLIGKTMMQCYPGIENTPLFEDMSFAMDGKGIRRLENEFVYEDGTRCWFELFIEPHTHGVLIRSVDISEKKIIEENFRHAQKLEAIGQLAGGIAHDFNNHLAVMLAYCEMAQLDCAKLDDSAVGEKINRSVNKVLKAVGKSAALTKQLLAFGRRQVLDIKVTNLNTLLNEIYGNLMQLLGEHIVIKTQLAADLGNVSVDPNQFEQAFLNLCLNARDAMENGGELLIETQNVILDEEYSRLHPQVTAGDYVMLSVTDTGCGMEPTTLSRVFEPFFTTKGQGKGTGLGLAMVHGFVNQSNGFIWAYSELGQGTTFKVYLPLVKERQAKKKAKERKIASSHRGQETILLVEDDLGLAEVYLAACRSAGYSVILANDGKAAEKLMLQHRDTIDLLLTDLMLPYINGRELARRLFKHKPDLLVIYMSGYTENTIVHKGILDTDSILLQKPISLQTLLETIRKVLDGQLVKGLV